MSDHAAPSGAAMNVVCAVDAGYVRHCGVMLLTLRDANPTAVLHVFVLHDGLCSDEAARLLRCLEGVVDSVSLIHVDATLSRGFPVSGHMSLATYLRLFLGAALPSTVERALFLDADMVITDSLAPLWSTPLDGRSLGAVPNPRNDAHRERLRLADGQDYFNAGVLLVDLRAWRGRDLVAEGAAFVREHPDRVVLWDQDVLNHLFRGDWLALPPRWNAVPHWWSGAQGRVDPAKGLMPWREGPPPAVVHFAGSGQIKPWHHACVHPYRERYRAFLARTPWRHLPLEGAPLTRLDRTRLRLRRWLGLAAQRFAP